MPGESRMSTTADVWQAVRLISAGSSRSPWSLRPRSRLSWLSTLSSHSRQSTIEGSFLETPAVSSRRFDFLRLWDTCTANSSVSTCINHQNEFPASRS